MKSVIQLSLDKTHGTFSPSMLLTAPLTLLVEELLSVECFQITDM